MILGDPLGGQRQRVVPNPALLSLDDYTRPPMRATATGPEDLAAELGAEPPGTSSTSAFFGLLRNR